MQVILDPGQLRIGRRDEQSDHQAKLLLCESKIIGRLHGCEEESHGEHFDCGGEHLIVGVRGITCRIRFRITAVLGHLLQVLAVRSQSPQSQIHCAHGVAGVRDRLGRRGSRRSKRKRGRQEQGGDHSNWHGGEPRFERRSGGDYFMRLACVHDRRHTR